MERKFRFYRLTIGKPIIVHKQYFSPRQTDEQRHLDLETFYNRADNNGFVIESSIDGSCFALSFDCNRESKTNAECSIDIHNLDDEITRYIIDNSEDDLLVKLEAGYVGEVKRIIEGTVTMAHDSWSKETRTLSLVVADANVNKRDAYTVRSYGKNTPVDKIVKDCVSDMGLKTGVIVRPEPYPVTKVPVSWAGNPNEIIHTLAKQYKHVFTINDQHVYFTPKDKMLKQTVAYLSAGTGLIDNATRKKKRKKKKKSKDEDDLITVKSQLDGSIFPDQSVWVKDNTIDTAIKVKKCRLKGSFPKGDWICLIDGSPLEATIQ